MHGQLDCGVLTWLLWFFIKTTLIHGCAKPCLARMVGDLSVSHIYASFFVHFCHVFAEGAMAYNLAVTEPYITRVLLGERASVESTT